MENASEALLIAGGILLGILTITLLVYMFGNLSNMESADMARVEQERLNAWNAEWEAYNKRLLYGTEVLTVINKAEQNNHEYECSEEYYVTYKILQGNTQVDKSFVETKKTSIFECTAMNYSNETGRINEVIFKFIE